MTHLLLRNFIISGLIPTDPLYGEAGCAMGIETGVDASSGGGVLRRLFSARSLVLFNKLAPSRITSNLYGLALTAETCVAFDGFAECAAES